VRESTDLSRFSEEDEPFLLWRGKLFNGAEMGGKHMLIDSLDRE
jgi:hypothetical protein